MHRREWYFTPWLQGYVTLAIALSCEVMRGAKHRHMDCRISRQREVLESKHSTCSSVKQHTSIGVRIDDIHAMHHPLPIAGVQEPPRWSDVEMNLILVTILRACVHYF